MDLSGIATLLEKLIEVTTSKRLMHCGNLVNKLIKDNHSTYSLEGMVNPTFQNQGESSVTIDGRVLGPGETYSVYAPIVLSNSISIAFENDNTKTRALYLGYVAII